MPKALRGSGGSRRSASDAHGSGLCACCAAAKGKRCFLYEGHSGLASPHTTGDLDDAVIDAIRLIHTRMRVHGAAIQQPLAVLFDVTESALLPTQTLRARLREKLRILPIHLGVGKQWPLSPSEEQTLVSAAAATTVSDPLYFVRCLAVILMCRLMSAVRDSLAALSSNSSGSISHGEGLMTVNMLTNGLSAAWGIPTTSSFAESNIDRIRDSAISSLDMLITALAACCPAGAADRDLPQAAVALVFDGFESLENRWPKFSITLGVMQFFLMLQLNIARDCRCVALPILLGDSSGLRSGKGDNPVTRCTLDDAREGVLRRVYSVLARNDARRDDQQYIRKLLREVLILRTYPLMRAITNTVETTRAQTEGGSSPCQGIPCMRQSEYALAGLPDQVRGWIECEILRNHEDLTEH